MKKVLQIKELSIEQLDDFIRKSKHNYKTTHQTLCFKVIQRIYKRLLDGYRFGDICIFNNEVIIDGNHRYIAYSLAGIEIQIRKYSKSHSDIIRDINGIIIDTEEDWDYNHIRTRKYCSDEFLLKENVYRIKQ